METFNYLKLDSSPTIVILWSPLVLPNPKSNQVGVVSLRHFMVNLNLFKDGL